MLDLPAGQLLVKSHPGNVCPKTDGSTAWHVCMLHGLPVQARRLIAPLIVAQVRLSLPDQTMTHDSTPELDGWIQGLDSLRFEEVDMNKVTGFVEHISLMYYMGEVASAF